MLSSANFRTFPWRQKQILSNIVSLICCEPQPSNSLCWNFRGKQGARLAISNLSLVSMCLMPPITMAITWLGQNARHPRPMSTCGGYVLSFFPNSWLCSCYIFFIITVTPSDIPTLPFCRCQCQHIHQVTALSTSSVSALRRAPTPLCQHLTLRWFTEIF